MKKTKKAYSHALSKRRRAFLKKVLRAAILTGASIATFQFNATAAPQKGQAGEHMAAIARAIVPSQITQYF